MRTSELPAGPVSGVMNDDAVTFARFSSLALALSTWARAHALLAPQYRSPPQLLGVTRSLRRVPNARPIVAVTLRGRGESEVVRDMVDGLLAVNPQPGPDGSHAGDDAGDDAGDAARRQLRDDAIGHLLLREPSAAPPVAPRPPFIGLAA